MKKYAGIGSRNTPKETLHMMTNIATWLEKKGFILRSGGAKGADTAFEKGCSTNKEIFLANHATSQAELLVKRYHPNWNACSDYAKKLHARNAFQILGATLDDPVEFVICYTPDGCERHEHRTIETGGTGTAISLASNYNIPIYNLANLESVNNLREMFKTL